jgi:signal transduction histidine kinase
MRLHPRSLQTRLALQLAVVILIATTLVVGIILYQGYQAADELGNEQLLARANELARYVTLESGGEARLNLPPRLEYVYQSAAATDLFLIQDDKGHTIAVAPREFGGGSSELPTHDGTPRYFRLEQFGPNEEDYYGLHIRLDSGAGPVQVTVAHTSDADALANALLRAFVRRVAWVIPMFAAATLAIGVWSIRRGLQPVLAVSERAAEISPTAIAVRLPAENVPSEIQPLVNAVNKALDRLEQGFVVQRQFTANAAHELRTPLAILTAALDNLDHSSGLEKLRHDAARMNRLVDQLLRVARLDAIPLDVRETTDLGAAIAGVVEYLAPWAVAQGRSIGFEWPDRTVRVHGNADALVDAVKNLIENAVCHTPVGTEVTVCVSQDGTISVADHGPGVAVEDRPHICNRFWRGPHERGPGAGLGLAIVAEVVRAHNATLEIADVPGGGALFAMRLPVEGSTSPSA